MPIPPLRRMLILLCATAVAFGLTATPALADSPVLRVEEFLPTELQDETPLDNREVRDLTADEDGNLLVTSLDSNSLDDAADTDAVLEFEERTEWMPRGDLTSEYSRTSKVAVSTEGDTYFSSAEGAIYRLDDSGTLEELVSSGEYEWLLAIAAGSEALYIADGQEIFRIDPDAPDDPEPVVEVDSLVSSMDMAEDTLYVATGDDVLAIEEPDSAEAEAESVVSVTLPQDAVEDVTVDEHEHVYAIGMYGLLALGEEQIFTEVTGWLIEATAEGIVVGSGVSDLHLVRNFTAEETTPSMDWAELPDLAETESVPDDSPGSLHSLSSAQADSTTITPTGEVNTHRLPHGATKIAIFHHTEDGTVWFIGEAGRLVSTPDLGPDAPLEVADAALMDIGRDLAFPTHNVPRFRFAAPGEDVLYLATRDEVFSLDSSGEFNQVLGEGNVENILGMSAQGDTAHLLEGDLTSDTVPRVLEVDSSGETREAFNAEDVEEIEHVNDFCIGEDGTYYMTGGRGDQIFRVDGDDVDIIAGATADQTVDGSDAATETALTQPERPMLDGSGNLIFSDDDGTHLIVDAANAPVHPDNDPWRTPRTLGPLVILALLTAGGVLWWLHRRTQAAEPTATPAAEKPKTSESNDTDEHH